MLARGGGFDVKEGRQRLFSKKICECSYLPQMVTVKYLTPGVLSQAAFLVLKEIAI